MGLQRKYKRATLIELKYRRKHLIIQLILADNLSPGITEYVQT